MHRDGQPFPPRPAAPTHQARQGIRCWRPRRPAAGTDARRSPAGRRRWRTGPATIEPNESMTSGSRNTSAPIGGPPHASAFTATTSASISSMSISRYGAAAEWSTTTRPPSVVHQLGDGPQIGDGAERRGGGGDGDQPGRLADQALPLPGRQLAGLDVDLGPFHLGAIAIRRAQPRRDVCLVVEPGDDHLIAQPDPRRRRVGQRVQQDGAVGAEDDAARVGVDQVGDRLAGRVQHRRAALGGRMRADRRRSSNPRNAVDTVVATESGSSMPFWASKCTQPSPNDGCNPRTRATSYAMPATLERL